jgi:hypothetical protein
LSRGGRSGCCRTGRLRARRHCRSGGCRGICIGWGRSDYARLWNKDQRNPSKAVAGNRREHDSDEDQTSSCKRILSIKHRHDDNIFRPVASLFPTGAWLPVSRTDNLTCFGRNGERKRFGNEVCDGDLRRQGIILNDDPPSPTHCRIPFIS